MNELQKRSLHNLLQRKKLLQDAYDAIISEPSAVSIVGSVNYTNRNLADLRKEIEEVAGQIVSLISGDPFGITRSYPKYYRYRG